MADEFKGARSSWTTDIADVDSAQTEAMEAVTKALPAAYGTAAHLVTSFGRGAGTGARAGRTAGRAAGRAVRRHPLLAAGAAAGAAAIFL